MGQSSVRSGRGSKGGSKQIMQQMGVQAWGFTFQNVLLEGLVAVFAHCYKGVQSLVGYKL